MANAKRAQSDESVNCESARLTRGHTIQNLCVDGTHIIRACQTRSVTRRQTIKMAETSSAVESVQTLNFAAECFDHVAIGCQDLVVSRRWYMSVLGMQDFMQDGNCGVIDVARKMI